MISSKKQIQTDTLIFIAICATLIFIGLIFIYSSSSVYALEKCNDAAFFVKKQLFGLLFGLCALAIARFFPISLIKNLSLLWLIGALLLTLVTCFKSPFAIHIHGSSRWLNIGGFAFQPSELLKIALILYTAHFIEKKSTKKKSLLHGYLPLLIILTLVSLILLKQPDFGLTVTLIGTVFLLLFIADFNTQFLFWSIGALIPLAITLIILRPYRVKRILTFLNPWNDPQGAGFQIIQSLIAIGSGGLWGVGIAQSKQKFFYLPMQHTDFIFSIIAEETGFLGCFCIILLFIALLFFGVRIALNLHTLFAKLVTIGFVILISLQALINIAVTTGLAPTKGIGLPFVSYGNSALVCHLIMLGIIINLVYHDAAEHKKRISV